MAGAKTAEKQSYTTAEAATYLGLATQTLYNWRRLGKGPKRIGSGKAARYRVSDLDAWQEAQAR